jgi:hypothetical protein
MTTYNIPLTAPQNEFISSPYKFVGLFAGLGSGKTEAAIIRLVTLMQQDAGVSVAHYFPTYRLASRRGLSGVQNYLKRLGYDYILNKTAMTITIPELNNGIYYLDTYSDPNAIVSYEICHCVIDELDVLKKEQAEFVFRKVAERVRQNAKHICGNTISVVSTPDGGINGYCYSKWKTGENINDGFHYIRCGTGSNPFLPKDYVDQISKQYDPVMLEAMVNGGWVSFTLNKIYHFYTRQRHKSTRTIQQGDHLHIGLDFNVGGTCATVFVIDGDIVTAVDEFVSHDTQDFINNLTRFGTLDITIYPDASGNSNRTNAAESDIAMIRRARWTVKHMSTNPAVRDRINAVNGLLSHDRFKVNADKCPELATALESQGYTDKGEPEKFTTHPAIDDRNDCASYCLAFLYPIRIERPAPPQHTHRSHATSWQS